MDTEPQTQRQEWAFGLVVWTWWNFMSFVSYLLTRLYCTCFVCVVLFITFTRVRCLNSYIQKPGTTTIICYKLCYLDLFGATVCVKVWWCLLNDFWCQKHCVVSAWMSEAFHKYSTNLSDFQLGRAFQQVLNSRACRYHMGMSGNGVYPQL